MKVLATVIRPATCMVLCVQFCMLAASCSQCSLRAVLSTLSLSLSGVWCVVSPSSPSSPPPNIRRHPEAAAVRRGGVQGGEYENV